MTFAVSSFEVRKLLKLRHSTKIQRKLLAIPLPNVPKPNEGSLHVNVHSVHIHVCTIIICKCHQAQRYIGIGT